MGISKDENQRIRCNFIDCLAGMGLAGSGRCFLNGAWWMECCGNFIDEEPFLYLYLHGRLNAKIRRD